MAQEGNELDERVGGVADEGGVGGAGGPEIEDEVVVVSEEETLRATALLDERRQALAAWPKEEVAKPRVSWRSALALSHRMKALAVNHLNDDEFFRPSVMAEARMKADGLVLDALTFMAALAPIEADPLPGEAMKAQRRDLVKRVRAHDQRLSDWARPFFGRHPVEGPMLAQISPGTGPIDDAHDVVSLVAMFRRHWGEVAGKSPITTRELDSAEGDATALLAMDEPVAETDSKRELAHRAYSVWSANYRHVLRFGRFLAPEVAWPGIVNLPGRRSPAVAPVQPVVLKDGPASEG